MRLVLLGAGGHARVVLEAARSSPEIQVLGCTRRGSETEMVDGVPILGTDDVLGELREKGATHGIVAVGSVRIDPLRATLFALIEASGLAPATIIHAAATVSKRAEVEPGTAVLARATINSGARIGRNVIVNTGAIVEHDCRIGDHVHVAPGAVLGGAVHVGNQSHIGIGAIVLQGVHIGDRVLIGAGAVVIRDVADGAVVAGVPARPLH